MLTNTKPILMSKPMPIFGSTVASNSSASFKLSFNPFAMGPTPMSFFGSKPPAIGSAPPVIGGKPFKLDFNPFAQVPDKNVLDVDIVAKAINNLSSADNNKLKCSKFKDMLTEHLVKKIKKTENVLYEITQELCEEENIALGKEIDYLMGIFPNKNKIIAESKLCATNIKDAENALTKCFALVKAAKERKCEAETRHGGLENINDWLHEEYKQECREAKQKMEQARIKMESQCTVGINGKLSITNTPKLNRKRKVVKTWEKSVAVFNTLKDENGPSLRSLNMGKIHINEAKVKFTELNQALIVAKKQARTASKTLAQTRNKAKVINVMLDAVHEINKQEDVLFNWRAAEPSVLGKRNAIEISSD